MQYQDCNYRIGNIDTIRFQQSYQYRIKVDSQHKGDFLLLNLHKYATAANTMCRLYNHQRKAAAAASDQQKDACDLQLLHVYASLTQEEAFKHYMPFYCRYTNKVFEQWVSGVPHTATDGWASSVDDLTEIVYGGNQGKSAEEIQQIIELIFCKRFDTSLKKIFDSREWLWYFRFNDDFINQIPSVNPAAVPALCSYLISVWGGHIVSWYDMYSSVETRAQPFQISPTTCMQLDFAELVHTEMRSSSEDAVKNDQNDNSSSKNVAMSTYCTGRVMPTRFATTQLVKDNSAAEAAFNHLQNQYQLTEFTPQQFISIDGLYYFESAENVEVIVSEKVDIVKKKKRVNLFEMRLNKHFHRKWDDFALTNDVSAKYARLFRWEHVLSNDLGHETPSSLKQFKSVVAIQSDVPTFFKISNTKIKHKHISNCALSTYRLDADGSGIWSSEYEVGIDICSAYKDAGKIQVSDQRIIDKLSRGKTNHILLNILEQLPTLDIRLSPQQASVVTSTENMLCLGRSGTGKTTSSVLRLFSQQIMFILLKKRELIRLKNSEHGQIKVTSADLLEPVGMKSVFLSASPVLVNEVQRFYNRLKDALYFHLLKKEREAKDDDFVDISADTDEVDKQVKREHDSFLQLATYEAELIEEELAAQQQMDIPAAYEDLKPKDFPLFVTVKQLLYMLDASLGYSFFARDKNNRMLGMANNLSWHNENRGMFMINSQYKSDQDFDQLLQEYGEMLITEEENEMNQGGQIEQEDIPAPATTKVSTVGRYYNNRYTEGEFTVMQGEGQKKRYHGQVLSFEVDFEIFESRFFCRFANKKGRARDRLSAAVVWTEIFSVIKGGLDASRQWQGYFKARDYIKYQASDFLSRVERQTIYAIFLEYERWKAENNGFDLMDLVSFITNSNKVTSTWFGSDMRMDFLMIDEVQDLTPTTMQLLLKLTKEKVYFAGDTAQTIAKGVGARFSDLRTLINKFGCQIIQLTTNYRSHGKILNLANSVVEILEVLFPFSIDSLVKERSLTDGMRPLILQPMTNFKLKRLFLGESEKHINVQVSHSMSKPQFGCNQVVIVRDQHHKDLLPEFLQNMLCLTVYEAKGLEFDDVILYDFFNSKEIAGFKWKLINDIEFQNLSDEDLASIAQLIDEQANIESQKEKELTGVSSRRQQIFDQQNKQKLIQKSLNRGHVYRKYSALCIELKMLYVAITRPKKRLIIYDSDNQSRLPIQRIWEHLRLVDIVSDQQIADGQCPEHLQDLFAEEGGILGANKSTNQEWKVQGIKFFKKKQFDQAYKCFQFADEQLLATKCLAYQLADQAQSKLTAIQPIQFKIQYRLNTSKFKVERKQAFRQIAGIKSEARKLFERAGDNFYACGNKQQAASCYFTSNRYSKASKVFEEIGQYGQAAECTMRQSKSQGHALLKAAEMFLKGNLVSRAIECYERLEAWESLLFALYKSKSEFKPTEWQTLYNKYVPIALNKLYLLMMGEEQLKESNQGAVAELKVRQKYAPKPQNTTVIEEADEEDDSEEYFSEDSEKDGVPAEAETQEVGEEPHEQEAEDSDASEEDQGVEILEDVFDLTQKKKERQEQLLQQAAAAALQQKESEEANEAQQAAEETKSDKPEEEANSDDGATSFEVVSNPGSNPDADPASDEVNKMMSGKHFDHVSSYDPDDENLQSEHSFQLINSILSGQDCEEQSEFSIVDDSNQSFAIVDDSQSSHSVMSYTSSALSKGSLRLVRSQRKVADAVIRKIIYYVALFADEVRARLRKLDPKLDLDNLNPEDINLATIDTGFVEEMLIILEKFDLIKLCFILCAKFKLSQRVGSYTVSACLKYQSLQPIRYVIKIDQVRAESSIVRQRNRHRALISHEAIHNVFSLISSNLLRLKNYREQLTPENSLGLNHCRMIFLLGFWKKLVYTMSLSNGVDLAYRMADAQNHDVLMERVEEVFGEMPDPQAELHSAQRTLIYLKQANIIIFKHADKFKRGHRTATMFQNIFGGAEEELAINQLLEKPYVKDLFGLVKFLLVPPEVFAQANQDKKAAPVLKINLLDKSKAVDIEMMRREQFGKERQQIIHQGKEIFSRHFNQVATDRHEQLIQQILAATFTSYGCHNPCLRTLLVGSIQSYQNLLTVYSQLNLKNLISREALLTSANMATLDTTDFMTGETNEDESDLLRPFAQTYILTHTWSPLLYEILQIQQQTLNYERDKLFIEKCLTVLQEDWKHNDIIVNVIPKIAKYTDVTQVSFEAFFERMSRNVITEKQAYIVDMDLNFMLVPIEWVSSYIMQRVSLVAQQLNKCWQSNLAIDLSLAKNGLARYENFANYLRLYNQTIKSPQKILEEKMNDQQRQVREYLAAHEQLNSAIDKQHLKTFFIKKDQLPKSLAIVSTQKAFNSFFSTIEGYVLNDTIGTLKFFKSGMNPNLAPLLKMSLLAINQCPKISASRTQDQCLEMYCTQLSTALKLLQPLGQLPAFIAEAIYKLKYLQFFNKSERDVLVGFKQEAYAMIAFEHWELHKGLTLSLQSYYKLQSHSSIDYSVHQLQKMFYTLVQSMAKTCYLPLNALLFLDSTADIDSLRQAAEVEDRAFQQDGEEDEYDNENYYDQQEDSDYYDETDTPLIQDIRKDNIQIVKQKSIPLNREFSRVPARSIINYSLLTQWRVCYQTGQKQMRQILKLLLQQVKFQSENESKCSLLLQIFDMLVCLIVNVGFKNYSLEITDCIDAFSGTPVHTDIQTQLLKYVSQYHEISELWDKTDDLEKYAFFTRSSHIVRCKLEFQQAALSKCYDKQEALLVAKRLRALRTIRRMLKPALQHHHTYDTHRKLRASYELFHVDPHIRQIRQQMASLGPLLSLLHAIENRMHSLTHVCLSVSETVPSFLFQSMQNSQTEYRHLKRDTIKSLNEWIANKASILAEFIIDDQPIDGELSALTSRAERSLEAIDAMLQVNTKLALLRHQALQKGCESSLAKQKRLQIKWQSMNMLKTRQQRLRHKLGQQKQHE